VLPSLLCCCQDSTINITIINGGS